MPLFFVKSIKQAVFINYPFVGSMMRKILSIGVILFLITTIGTAYAELDEVDVPFKFTGKGCFVEEEKFQYHCVWDLIKDPVTGELIVEIPEEPGTEIQTEEESELELVKPTDQPKPKTVYEIEIEKLTKQLEEDGQLPSHEAQLLMALLSLQEECELGTEEGAPIQNYEVFLIATFEPYTHTDLGTQYILKQIELAIQECKSQEILKKKVLGPQYLHIPSTNEPKIIYQTNATLPEDVQAKYDEAKMFDYFLQKTTNDAEDYKCTKEGRARGLGFDCKRNSKRSFYDQSLESKWPMYASKTMQS